MWRRARLCLAKNHKTTFSWPRRISLWLRLFYFLLFAAILRTPSSVIAPVVAPLLLLVWLKSLISDIVYEWLILTSFFFFKGNSFWRQYPFQCDATLGCDIELYASATNSLATYLLLEESQMIPYQASQPYNYYPSVSNLQTTSCIQVPRQRFRSSIGESSFMMVVRCATPSGCNIAIDFNVWADAAPPPPPPPSSGLDVHRMIHCNHVPHSAITWNKPSAIFWLYGLAMRMHSNVHAHTCTHAHTHARTYTKTHARTHERTHARTHALTNTHMH